jgi:hypothetical protein
LRPVTRKHQERFAEQIRKDESKQGGDKSTEEEIERRSMVKAAQEFLYEELNIKTENMERIGEYRCFRPRNVNTTSEVVYITVRDRPTAALILSHSRFIQKNAREGKVSLEKFIPPQAWTRYQAIENMAYNIRNKEKMRTDVRIGNEDFILRKREKGSTTPWGMITPEDLPEDLPKIDFSQYGANRGEDRERNKRRSRTPCDTGEKETEDEREQEKVIEDSIIQEVITTEKEKTQEREGNEEEVIEESIVSAINAKALKEGSSKGKVPKKKGRTTEEEEDEDEDEDASKKKEEEEKRKGIKAIKDKERKAKLKANATGLKPPNRTTSRTLSERGGIVRETIDGIEQQNTPGKTVT